MLQIGKIIESRSDEGEEDFITMGIKTKTAMTREGRGCRKITLEAKVHNEP
jgi:hypothetical protein